MDSVSAFDVSAGDDEEALRKSGELTASKQKVASHTGKRPERLKDKLKAAKDDRADRMSAIGMPHRHICDMVATFWGIDQNEVAEGVADCKKHIDLFESFMAAFGRQGIIFYSQDGPPYELTSGRYCPNAPCVIRRIGVTDGSWLPLTEKAVLVYRCSNAKPVDMRNICEDVFYANINLKEMKGNIMGCVSNLMQKIFLPSVQGTKEWGDLLKTEAGMLTKHNFLCDVEFFSNFLEKTRVDLDESVIFNISKELYVKVIVAMGQPARLRDPEMMQQLETVFRNWIKQVEYVLTQFVQLRRENEFVGPFVEVEYWRRQLARFSSIAEFYKEPECESILCFLEKSKCKLIKIWKELSFEVIEARNKCQDNVKYLYALEKYCEPLYRYDPTKIPNYIPSLLYMIRMVFTTSRYYNKTQSVTAIMVKISNQMINMCRSYINCSGTLTIWQQRKEVVLRKIEVCLDLYLKYYQCFKQTQVRMEDSGERPFDCSEMYVFGKFETFKKRLEKIVDVLNTTIKYSILQKSTVEGIDEFADKFKEFYLAISSTKYDALNHRQDYFDQDYKLFKQKVADIEWDMEEFVGNTLEKLDNTDDVLRMLIRFSKLNLECLHVDERYLEALEMYQEEIEEIRDQYNEDRQSPELPRLIPPVSGRVMWIRQLYARIEEPMKQFQTRERVMRHRKAQKVIQLYNSLASVFEHYEQIYHKGWFDYCAQVRTCLCAPLLLKHHLTKRYIINFDPYIMETIRETEYMYKLNLDVPDCAKILTFCKHKILNSHSMIKQLVERNDTLRHNTLKLFIPLLRPHLVELENVFMPGFSTITWTSMKIPTFCDEINAVLDNVQMFIKMVTDMKEARIDEVLENISGYTLVYLPTEPMTPAELMQQSIDFKNQTLVELKLKLYTAERAVVELIDTFLDTVTEPSLQAEKYNWLDPDKAIKPVSSASKVNQENIAFKEIDRNIPVDITSIHNDCLELFAHFNAKCTECLVKCTKLSLDLLKKRATATSLLELESSAPMMKTTMELHIPIAVINPTLEEIQLHFSQVLNNVLNIHKEIQLWGQTDPRKPEPKHARFRESMENKEEEERNYYKIIAEQKEISRVFMGLQGAMFLVKPDVNKLLQELIEYAFLWAEDREKQVSTFVEQNPLNVEIVEKFTEYDNIAEQIRQIPEFFNIGPVQILMDKMKLALLVESEAWKHLLGKHLQLSYKDKLDTMVDFIKAQEKVLSKPIKDLDDCRLAMACLARIRDNFIEMDMDLALMEEAYATFTKFKIDVPKEDVERVESLRYNFSSMVNHGKVVQTEIIKVQGPLQAELAAGVAVFGSEVNNFDLEFEINGPMIPGLSAREASDRVLIFQAQFDDLWNKFEMYSSGEALFGLEVHEYAALNQRKKDLNLLQKLYGLFLQVNNTIDGYFDLLWVDVDTEAIMTELTDFQNKCRKLPKAMKDWPAFLALKKKIDDFNETCPLLDLMANKAMKDRHWTRLSAVCKFKFDIESPSFSLKNVMQAPLLQYKDDVEDICISAVKEKDIEAKLKQVMTDWAIVDLQFSVFKSRGEVLLKGQDTGDVIALLEDSLMILNSLLSNRYNAPFKKDIQLWVNKLVTTSEILEKWMIVQNLWIYLEAVFVGGDISKQLPAEAKRFSNIDKTWVKIMYRAHELPNVVECCTGDETMVQLLPYLLDQLETCQKSLTGYLESKRLCFPRFFFISDPVLLEILGQSSDPRSIQPHLLSLFDAVFRVVFDENKPDDIIAMQSDLGETVPFDKQVTCQGGVELWLNALLCAVRDTVRSVIAQMSQCFVDPEYNFIKGFVDFCGQAGLVGVQVFWTKDAEIALRKAKADRLIMKMTNQKFLDLLNDFIDLTSKDLTRMQRMRYETMVTIHIHQRDIFDEIVRLKVKSVTDFEWQKQARFYYNDENDEILVKITDVIFIYQNEYLGITERLAITPLTDRCYITLAQAIWMNMGGAPAGPAGTGKTETTKDMGRTLGKFVVVFNCSDQMDFRGLGRIFKGLAQSGTWGCFDEFNRIELPVLSVAAQQIYIVLTARKERKAMFIFMDGDNVAMNIELGMFLTMNPGYAGRQELPENLKIMFRSVAMMVPDRQIIIRVKLASCGFKDNVILSKKFFTLYKLCEEQLSKQVHYDFGLRNILSVLRTLGAQKRSNPSDSEETVVMRVLRDMNLSKLVDEDEPLFLSLIDDMFPGIKLTTFSWKELQKAVNNQCTKMGLVVYPSWNLKIVQLYETYLVRHGLMVLGPTGAGKTRCTWILQRAMTENGLPTKEMRMNPKAITAPQMFGRLDVATNDWTDGIFSTLWRRTLKVKKTDFTWLVLDGPVDAVWIENLNSVLDDNKTLTLANGDRIVMAANSKIVFEPDNVDNASPATVSRMGMVFMSASVLPWQPILEAWLKTRSSGEADVLRSFFNKVYDDLHNFIQVKLKPKMAIREALYVRQCYDVLEGLLTSDDGVPKVYPEKHMERLFLFAVMWSLGAVLELDDRMKLEQYATKSKMDWPKCGDKQTIFEFVVGDNGKWQHWTERVEPFLYPDDEVLDFNSILVPNVDNVRAAFLIETIAKQNKAVLLIGEPGTAKTVMIKGYLNTFDPEYKISKSFNFSSATTPNMVQRIIESYVDKRVGTTYGPPAGKTLSIFIDDISMPVVNDWGDQVTNEIVRQLMEQNGFYSLDKPGDFSYIVDAQFLAAMIHPGGGRNDIPHRLKRQFCVFNCTLPSNTSMDMIFSSIGEGYFCSTRFNDTVVGFIPRLVALTRNVWVQTKGKMLPTPAKFHYVFNLRDLSRIWQGILIVQGPECQSISSVLKLWQHECTRVISDRFTNQEDKDWFVGNLRRQAAVELGDLYEHFPSDETFWVDYLREPPEVTGDEPDDFCFDAPKIYEEIPSWEFVKNKLLSYLESYNENARGGEMDTVFFHDAMVHVNIVSRIIRLPRGNALLVGVGGSGKQSVTKLASFIANYKFFQVQLTRSYNLNNFMDDMKYLYRVSGLEGSGISFIFTDNDIKEETFLESLNNVLSSGEIANLFAKDEMDEIQNELIPIMKKVAPKKIPTNDILYDFFISRARSNLHTVLCFSPVGEKFRSRAMKFPGLISGCTVDWFAKWPKDALVAVSNHFLGGFPLVCTPEVRIELIRIMGDIQESVSDMCTNYYERFRRQTYVTPKTFLSFLSTYKTLYTDKHGGIEVLAHRMRTGLTKLVEAAESVDVLRKELEIKNVEILVASAAAEKVLAVVEAASQVANKIKGEALVVKERAETLVTKIGKDQKEAEKKLRAAKPAMEAAEAALQTIKPADIMTVKKLGKPPHLIMVIMDAVCIYFGRKLEQVKPDFEKTFLLTSWGESLKVMSDSKFLSNLVGYKKDTINGEMIDLLVPYFEFPAYTFESAKQACGNVAGLLSWTMAMSSFYSVNKEVLPLKANLVQQQAKLGKAEAQLKAAMDLLQAKEAEVKQCQMEYDEAMTLKQTVLDDAQRCQNKMDQASALINGLSGERVRWTEQSALFKAETERLIGDVVMLVGFLNYAGPFNQEFRVAQQAGWLDSLVRRKIPVSMTINIIDSLTDTATIGEWNLQGLPTDELSIQNGIIVTKAARYALLIDPQSQGKNWLKSMEKENHLIVTTLNHKYFRNHIEDCVSLGYPMLIEDIMEELDPVLDNVMEKNYIKLGSSYKVKVGDKEVDFNVDFRMYITTKLANPSYTPEIYARASIIDFTVTMKGLEDQLLGRVILTEKKELETERTTLLKGVTANKRKMLELEANLLYKLTTTQGSLVDDESVLEVLNVTQSTAADVRAALEIARDTEIKINAAREEFRSVATRGSVLYFLTTSMAMVNCMYQTSLEQFLERFDLSMFRSEKTPITQRRIQFIIDYMTYEIFRYKSRGLYEVDKYMFVLLMTLKIDMNREYVTHEEFQYLIKGGAALDLNACPEKPAKWITDMTWLNLVELSKLRHFQYILTQVEGNEKAWKSWFDKDAPEEFPIPDGYNSLDPFRKLLMIRAWCTDRTLIQSRRYIAHSMGQRFAEPVILNMDALYVESRPITPMVCFLTMGSDPTPAIENLAKKQELQCKCMSMGQGQEVHARKLLAQAMTDGFWALLQNCHLGLDYMMEVLLLCLDLEKNSSQLHPDFRLWITTEVHPGFPISLLQLCLKFTNEPPSGVRAGLLRTYTSMGQDMLDYSDSPLYLPLIYGVSFLHTVVQERRKFGPLGWNIPYEFNSADWLSCCMFVQNHLDDIDPEKGISWLTVRYMIGEVHYGGRVTDDYDKILLNTFGTVWFSDVMFQDDFVFYKGYKILRFKNLTDYIPIIEAMPPADPPQVYGLHPNADITYMTNTTTQLLYTILSIQPKQSGGGGGETREAAVTRQTLEMLSKLPPDYDPYDVKERLRIMGHLNPLNIFLRQEIDRMQKVIKLVRTTLKDLLLAVEGTIIMNESLRDALDCIYDAMIPTIWKRGSWLSSTLGFWFTELLERNAQFRAWCFGGRPLTFWMTGFFNPQGFLTAMRQEVTRAHKGWALDQVVLHNSVTRNMREEVKAPPGEGVYVYGLYLDGAGWDRKNCRLMEATNKVLYTMIPVVHVFAIYSTAPKDPSLYQCPVYKKPRRTDLNFITPLWLMTNKKPTHWTLRGAALLCDIK